MIFSAQTSKLISNIDKVLIAVSGGVDSIALLQAVHIQCLTNIVVLHVDHQLRDGSAGEAKFVQAFCEERQIECVLESIIVNPDTSLQGTARIQRHAIFRRCAARFGIEHILTAHHLDDYAETLMMNFGRGAGINALAFGLKKERPPFIYLRPFFDVSRKDIAAFAEDQSLTWCEDPSNSKGTYLRNRLRHNLVDLREHYGAGLKQSALRIQDASEIVNKSINLIWLNNFVSSGPYHISFRRDDLQKDVPLLREFLRYLSTSFFGITLNENNIEQCVSLIRSGKKTSLSLHGIQVEQSTNLIFRKNFGRGDRWWSDVNQNFVLKLNSKQKDYTWFDWTINLVPSGPLFFELCAGKKIEIRNWKRGMTRDENSLSKIVKTHTKIERWRIPCLVIDEEVHWILGDKRREERLGLNLVKQDGTFVDL